MNLRQQLLLLSLIFVLLACSTQQQISRPVADGMPREPGKCYSRCLFQEKYEIDTNYYYSFTGDLQSENVDLITEAVVVEVATNKWVKKKADRNCLSADPNDCMIWCFVEVPQKYQTITRLKDTIQTKNFVRKEFIKKTTVSESRFTEWREVVCADKITADLVKRVQKALISKGYDVGVSGANNILGADTKTALVKFQKENNLPVGQLDFETLKALGVRK